MGLNVDNIKKLREETGAGILEVKETLAKFDGDYAKALEDLMSKASAKAAKKSDREIKDGLVYSYIHGTGKVGALVLMGCETDFVAKTDDFTNLCKDVAMQVCTGDYDNVEQILQDPFIKDSSKTVQSLINDVVAKLGENITLLEFKKLSVN
ncbi:MAG: elongation factor Ts [Patescibacteria group bacterium]|uniref:Elongation factor Ts n=1 Tax=candidate division WWE3 bacterium TaxID=2053526 RepID=A0A955EBZ8_UNCKA|nr:elongation factor Ts [candidate division WWE3 bacterium]